MIRTIEWDSEAWEIKKSDLVQKEIESDAENALYISDLVERNSFRNGCVNLITSSCGAGKSYFVLNKLRELFPDVLPSEIIIVTSRAITATQQSQDEKAVRIYASDPYQWYTSSEFDFDSDGIQVSYVDGSLVPVTTYASFCSILEKSENYVESKRIIVFDEFHSVFVDSYTEYSRWLPIWIREKQKSDTLLVAITATPDAVYRFYNGSIHSVLNDGQEIRKYRANNMYCTFYDAVPSLVRKLDGKTLILCNDSIKCEELSAMIPYSVVLYGRGHQKHTRNMGLVLDYISMSDTIPDGVYIPSGNRLVDGSVVSTEFPFKTIISTTVIREGVNIREYSGIRNIVCCSSDTVDIIQFAGRCRYNIDNLIIAPVRRRKQASACDKDFMYRNYLNFIETRNENDWSNTVIPAVFSGTYNDVNVFNSPSTARSRKIKYANLKHNLVPFERMMLEEYVNDITTPTDKWVSVGKDEFKRISEMARKTLYFHQLPSQMTVKKSLDYFCKKFDVSVLESELRGKSKIRKYYMIGKERVFSITGIENVNMVDAALYIRYSNMPGTPDDKLIIIPPDEVLDIRFRALQEMVFGSLPVVNYSIERICKRFCDLYGHHMKYVTRTIEGNQVNCIALIQNGCEGEK